MDQRLELGRQSNAWRGAAASSVSRIFGVCFSVSSPGIVLSLDFARDDLRSALIAFLLLFHFGAQAPARQLNRQRIPHADRAAPPRPPPRGGKNRARPPPPPPPGRPPSAHQTARPQPQRRRQFVGALR